MHRAHRRSRTATCAPRRRASSPLAGYVNAGTVEFLYQPAEQRFAFLEVNTRLQVEHPVTELTTGLDLVKLQLHVAAGGRLDGEMPPTEGFAIEARLNAEDPQRGFAPSPGRIQTLSLPFGPGIRVDTGVAEGDVIPPEFDSMIAKVIAHGHTRDEAIARLHRALSQMTVVVDGGTTNKSFLLDLLDRPEVRAGAIDTSWLDRLTAAGAHLPTRHGDVALVAAALDADELLAAIDRAAFFGAASRGRAHADTSVGREIELRLAGQSYRLDGPPTRRRAVRRRAGRGRGRRRGRAPRSGVSSRLSFGGLTFAVVSSVQGSDHLVEVDGVAHRCSRDDAGIVRAPAASLVVGIDVQPDQVVSAGDRLGVVEAMKMEIGITAPVSGRVRDVFVARNVQVDAGAPLFRIEPVVDDDADVPAGERVGLGALRAERRTAATRRSSTCSIGEGVPARVRRHRRRGERRAGGGDGADEPRAARRCRSRAGDRGGVHRSRRRGAGASGSRQRRRRHAGAARALPRVPALARRRA